MTKMKVSHKNKDKNGKHKRLETIKPKKEQVLVIAQEIKFARLLSGNEKKSRDKVLKTLKKWLLNCFEKKYEFKEDDFVRVWKGLFYAVWMSDKLLIQEELCENVSEILDLFPPEQLKYALLMYKAGLRVLATEWYGVDQHRMDKFLMLVRRYLRASLRCLARSDWSLLSCQMYSKVISGSDGILALKTPRYARNAASMLLHLLDCYLEEIAKVSNGDIPPPSVAELLRPVCRYMCSGELPILAVASRRVLTALLRQSDPGIKYQHAAQAWQKMGCPAGGPEALELVSDDEDAEENGEVNSDLEEDSSEKPLDPRAGRVNVELPSLPVPADLLADMLRDMLANATSKAHKRVRICLQRFEQLSRNEYPLRIPTLPEDGSPTQKSNSTQVAHSLQALEKNLVVASDELALRGLSRKHRKRLLAKSRSGLSIVEDVEQFRQETSSGANGEWKVEPTDTSLTKLKQDKIIKENTKRKSVATAELQKKKRKIDKFNVDIHILAKDNSSETTNSLNSMKSKSNIVNNKNKPEKTVLVRNQIKKAKVNGVSSEKIEIKKVINAGNMTKRDKNKEKVITNRNTTQKDNNNFKNKINAMEKSTKIVKNPTIVANKVKNYQKQSKTNLSPNKSFDTPKKVKFVLKNNSMQAPIDYYKSIRQSPNIPFDGTKQPNKTNLKPSTPSPINPFFKKKLKLKY